MNWDFLLFINADYPPLRTNNAHFSSYGKMLELTRFEPWEEGEKSGIGLKQGNFAIKIKMQLNSYVVKSPRFTHIRLKATIPVSQEHLFFVCRWFIWAEPLRNIDGALAVRFAHKNMRSCRCSMSLWQNLRFNTSYSMRLHNIVSEEKIFILSLGFMSDSYAPVKMDALVLPWLFNWTCFADKMHLHWDRAADFIIVFT